jgi:hypothetical protein
MPTSILEVDVNDESFKQFYALFQKYQAELKALPGAWGAQHKAVDGVADAAGDVVEEVKKAKVHLQGSSEAVDRISAGLRDMTAAMMAQAAAQAKAREARDKEMREERAAEKAQRESERKVAKANSDREKSYKKIKDTAKGIENSVERTTMSMLKWVSIGGITSAVLGGFGLAGLAGGLGNARRDAQGLGVDVGEQKALGLTYGRYTDVNAALGNISEAQLDPSRQWAFAATGINPAGKDPGQLLMESMMKAKTMFDRDMAINPASALAMAQAQGLMQGGLGFGAQDLRRLNKAKPGELEARAGQEARLQKELTVPDEVLEKWQDFQIKIASIGTKVEMALAPGLEKLIGPLGQLGDQVANALSAFMKTEDWQADMQQLGKDITGFAARVHDWAQDGGLQRFADGVNLVANEVMAAAERLKWLLPDKNAPPAWKPDAKHPILSTLAHNGAYMLNPFDWSNPALGSKEALYATAEKRGVPGWLLNNIYGTETAFGHNAGPSIAGAKGLFQMMDGTAKQYGVTDPMNFGQASDGAARYLADLMKHYGGDTTKTAAAYNWGQGNLDKDIAKWGADWDKHLPGETSDYLIKTAAAPSSWYDANGVSAPSGARVDVRVENATGGNANVNAAQLPQ